MNAQPAPLKRRAAALLYESLFVAAVAIVAGIFAGIMNTLVLHTLPALIAFMPIFTTFLLLYLWWFYFKINWLREGQTLPMRVWGIGLTTISGSRPDIKRLRMRFVWQAVFLVLIPVLAYATLRHIGTPPRLATGLAALWWILPWGFSLFHPRRQFLYDHLAGTELIDQRNPLNK